jgi:hypothetical protein
MDQLTTEYYQQFNDGELLWFLKTRQRGKPGKSSAPTLVQEARGLKWKLERFVGFWARDDILNNAENPWNKANSEPSEAMKDLYASIGVEYEYSSSHAQASTIAPSTATANYPNSIGTTSTQHASSNATLPSIAAVNSSRSIGTTSIQHASSNVTLPSPAAVISNSIGTTSTQHASSIALPAQTNSGAMGPPETSEYRRLKKNLNDLIAQVAAEGVAKVLSDLQGSNQG